MYRWYWMPATTTLQDNKFFLFNEICQILLGDFSTWFISIDWCKKGSLILHCKTFYNHQKINHMKKVLLFIYLLFNYIITFSQQIGQISFSKNPLNKGQIGNEKKFKSVKLDQFTRDVDGIYQFTITMEGYQNSVKPTKS